MRPTHGDLRGVSTTLPPPTAEDDGLLGSGSTVDLDAAYDLYTDALGLAEVERSNGAVYLGCGPDGNYDLALTEGGTGLEHFAVRVADRGALERHEENLKDHDVPFGRTDGEEPNQRHGHRFDGPSGATTEHVTVEDRENWHSAAPRLPGRSPHGPLDLDHVKRILDAVTAAGGSPEARYLSARPVRHRLGQLPRPGRRQPVRDAHGDGDARRGHADPLPRGRRPGRALRVELPGSRLVVHRDPSVPGTGAR